MNSTSSEMFDVRLRCMLTKVTRGSGQRARKHTTAPSTEEAITGECRAMVVQQGSWWLATGEWADSKREALGFGEEWFAKLFFDAYLCIRTILQREILVFSS